MIFAAQAALGSPRNSAAFDEEYHLAAGYAYLRTGDPRLSTEHPPLVNVWNALPLLFLDPRLPLDHPAWQSAMTDDFGDAFLWQANPHQAVQMVLLGRLPIIALGVLLGALIFRWARDLLGVKAGLLALALYSFDPNLIAHSRLSTTDLGLAACMTLAMWRLWAWLEKPTRLNLVLTGAAAGAAMATKFTGLALAPIFVLVALVHPVLPASRGKWWSAIAQRMLGLLMAAVVALLFIWGVYSFEVKDGWPAATYWRGLIKIWTEYSQGYPTFLLGQVNRTGWWYYFPAAFVLKTPLPTQILLVASLVLSTPRAWRRASAAIIPPAFLMAAALFSPLAIGYRHILPVLPFVIILASRLVKLQIDDSCFTFHVSRITYYVLRMAYGVLLFWLVISAARIFPHHLSFFNELAGGPSNGSHVLVDSNLDWGQDLPALKQLMAERGIEQVRLAYFGTAMPEAYGIRYTPLPGFLRFLAGAEVDAYNPYTPEPGWYAISATSLRLGLVYRSADLYAYFRDKTPAARAGYSINLYEVRYPGNTPVDRVVITGHAVADLTPEQLGIKPGHRLIAKWAQSPDTTIVPTTTLQSSDYAQDKPPTSNLPSSIDWGAFALIGCRIEHTSIQAGEAISATLAWQVGTTPVETPAPGYKAPLAMFVHLVGSDPSHIVAQYDGWETALTGLEAGDIIAQHVTIATPASAPPGAYRLLAGLYSPQSMQRLIIRPPDGAADHVELSKITIR